ncbi:hypothetical protein NQ317_009798 [Molorchus minor]|uniref:Uncharacterized protein n=1 Tax=Molorchus minor TaxID=1323400 RepID=A0ABQ9IWR5_9CUCU|nr:hypothetical protein NQ317_009798 [Molorchus minor]
MFDIMKVNTFEFSFADDKLSGSSLTDDATEKESLKIFPKRQNSNAIRTDNSGASVKTINHILNGITDSVNRLSELHVQISESPRSRIVRSTEISPHSIIEMNIRKSQSASDQAENQKNTTDESGVIVEGSPRINIKSKNAKKKSREPKLLNKKPLASHLSIRKTAKAEKRTKTASIKSATLDRDLYTMRKRSYLNSIKPNAQTHKLVEIYHNNAAKNSDSDETTGKPKQQVVNDNNQSFVNDIPPLEIPDKIENVGKVQNYGNSTCPRLAVIQNGRTDVCYDPPEAPRTEGSCFSKNYELPTIASKMKQVAKSYLTSFNLKAIPFCAAISTSPSHNIGINIQQVMNIIKTRQSVNGISPTLAHNIGLAAERINSRPLSTLVSTINSKSGYRTSRCPLSKTNVNYQQLQEMAKGIPEETAEEVQEEADSPAMKTVIITGPSGDVEIKNRNVPVWAADSKYSDQCTCIPQQGVDFQQIVSKYNRRNTPLTAKTVDTQVENRVSKFSISNKRRAQNPQKKVQYSKNGYNTNTINPAVETQETSDPNPLQGREKNLKNCTHKSA